MREIYKCTTLNRSRSFFNDEVKLPKTRMLVVDGWRVVGERDIQYVPF